MGNANYPIPRNQMSDIERATWRVFSKTNVGEWDECWEFKGATISDGYAHLRGVTLYGEHREYPYGHRTMWAVFNGRWPSHNEVVQHTCDNPPCVNPAHLIIGTQADNMSTRPRSGRWFGARTGKLTSENVLAIRASDKTQRELAREYNVTQTAISNVITGKTYAADGRPKSSSGGRGGVRPSTRKLSPEAVREIRSSTDSVKVLVERYAVGKDLIYGIRNGSLYADVT